MRKRTAEITHEGQAKFRGRLKEWKEEEHRADDQMLREMKAAAADMDRIREETKDPGWSGVREIRKWRDRDHKE